MKIAIVGGGPAGLIAALYLCRLPQAEIVIYEKHAASDYASTLCAEGLSDDKLNKLETDTGFSSRPFLATQIQGIKVTFPNRLSGLIYQSGATLERTAWQKGMIDYLRQQNVTVHFESAVSDPSQIDADWLIGADGPVSKVRKSINGKVTMKPAVQYRMKLSGPRRHKSDFLEFFFDEMFYAGKMGYGYGWVFPRGDLFNVGVAGTFEMLDAFLEKYEIYGEIVEKAGAPIAINGTCFEQGRVFLLGDAAGLTNPLSCGGLAAIICCADYLRQALEGGRPGIYTALTKTHHYHPSIWRHKHDLFYLPDRILEKAGAVCRNSRIDPKSPAFMARLAVRPCLWPSLLRMAPHIRAFKRVSW